VPIPPLEVETLNPSSQLRRRKQMSVLALFRWQGDADGLVAAYDRELKDAPNVVRIQPRRTLHVFARGQERAVVIDLWESEDDFRRMMDDPDSSGTSTRPAGQASQRSRFMRYTRRCRKTPPASIGCASLTAQLGPGPWSPR
jgi:hypothetical protein